MKKESLTDHDVEVRLKKAMDVHLSDHEILLSFVNDIGAVAFDRWWDEQGETLFEKWAAKQPKDSLE